MFLNLDAGELPSETEELWAVADVLNCACGGHAGDRESMARVAAFCAHSGGTTRLGAHPSYPDAAGFGRQSMTMTMTPQAVYETVSAQCHDLARAAAGAGTSVIAIKPHGALYHDAAASDALASAVARGAVEALGAGILMIGPGHGALHAAAERFGLRYAREGFADRAMRADGSLVPRSSPGALISSAPDAAAQALRLAPTVDTICIHGDTPGALAIARAVRAAIPR